MGDWAASHPLSRLRPEVRVQRATLARVWGRAPQGSLDELELNALPARQGYALDYHRYM